ncbi:MAG TPA: TRIC cation channel family protein [Solirubrobacteraceae bacterium]|nr:TRIC cation channel family protein [Solirubrobacteraceae bacterium]
MDSIQPSCSYSTWSGRSCSASAEGSPGCARNSTCSERSFWGWSWGSPGGTIRDVLIGTPPETFRDWRYLAVAGGAGLVTSFAHPAINRLQRPIDVLDAAGLALFCVTGAATALAHRLGVVDCVILGAITGIGGGVLRDILVREIPTVLRGGLYAIPALVGAGIVVAAYHSGDHTITFPIVGAAVCFAMRMAGLRYGLGLPGAADVALTGLPRLPRSRVAERTGGGEPPRERAHQPPADSWQ